MGETKDIRIYRCEKKTNMSGELETKEVTVSGESLKEVRKHFNEIWSQK